MEREKIDEMQLIIMDLRMAIQIKEDIEQGNIRPIATFADGEEIILPISDEVKAQIDHKIEQLEALLKSSIETTGIGFVPIPLRVR